LVYQFHSVERKLYFLGYNYFHEQINLGGLATLSGSRRWGHP